MRAGLKVEGVPAIRAAHLARLRRGLTRIQQSGPGNGLGQGSQVAQHDLDKMPGRVGGILGSARNDRSADRRKAEAD